MVGSWTTYYSKLFIKYVSVPQQWSTFTLHQAWGPVNYNIGIVFPIIRPVEDFQGPLDSHGHDPWSVCKVALTTRTQAFSFQRAHEYRPSHGSTVDSGTIAWNSKVHCDKTATAKQCYKTSNFNPNC